MKSQWRELPGIGLICVRVPTERAAGMISAYRAGKTLHEVGAEFGITRERVRQILRAYGFSGKDGGAAIRAKARQSEMAVKRDAKTMRTLGMTYAEYQAHIAEFGTERGSPLNRFRMQKHSAKDRGIEWAMTFKEWWTLWSGSGKWAERGRSGYVMARNGDVGPYAIGNVYICTSSENILDYYARAFPNSESRRGWRVSSYPVKSGQRWMVRLFRVSGKQYYAGFKDKDEARVFAEQRVSAQ